MNPRKHDWEFIDEWQLAMKQLFDRFGYMVVGASKKYVIGQIFDDEYGSGIPLKVISETTRIEAMAQLRSVAQESPDELVPPPEGWNYYRVVVAD